MKKVILMFIFLNFNVGAMKEEENQIYAKELTKEFESKFKEKLPKTLETTFKDFLTAYPVSIRTSSFINLAHLIFNEKFNLESVKTSENEKIIWVLNNLKSTNNALKCLQVFLKNAMGVFVEEKIRSALQQDIFDSLVGKNIVKKANLLQLMGSLNLDSYRTLISATTTGEICHIKDTKEMTEIEKADYDFLQKRIETFKDTLQKYILNNFQFSSTENIEIMQKNVIQKILLKQNIEKNDMDIIRTCLDNFLKIDFYTHKERYGEELAYYVILKDLLKEILIKTPWNNFIGIIRDHISVQDENDDQAKQYNRILLGVLHILNKYDQTIKTNKINQKKKIVQEEIARIIKNAPGDENDRIVKEKIYTESERNFEFMKNLEDPVTQLLNEWQPVKIEPVKFKKISWSQYFFNQKTGIFLGISALAVILFYFRKKIFSAPAQSNGPLIPSADAKAMADKQKNIELNDISFLFNNNS